MLINSLFNLPNDTAIYWEDNILLIPNEILKSDYDFFWSSDEGLSCINCFKTTAFPLKDSKYFLNVTDENGCSSSDEILIKVKNDINIYIPNIFTANGDGKNDYFYIRGSEKGIIGNSEFKIFNRWGELIFESSKFPINNSSYGWDGRYKDKQVNPDVFVYYITIDLIDGSQIVKKGDITVIH